MNRFTAVGLTLLALPLSRTVPAEGQMTRLARAAAPEAASETAGGLRRHLVGLPDILTLNKDGTEYQTVRFTHAAHSAEGYGKGIACEICHHTQKGDEKPEKCGKCHGIGGDAKETEAETRAAHSKKHPFPKETGQKAVSCIGCHKAQNVLLEEGKRSGKEAPTKCKLCHEEKES